MKLRLIQSRQFAFTVLELLILVILICILAVFLLPQAPRKYKARQVMCLNNQRQVAIGLAIFSSDHQEAFPARVSVTNGGAMEPMLAGDVVPCYVILTNSITSQSWFLCPADRSRLPAAQGQPITRTNVSYFISLDASPTNSPTYTILTGDRHLILNSKPIGPGLFSLTTNQTLEWSAELLHSVNKKPTGGAFSFADGHAEWVSPKSLSQVVARQNIPTNRLAVP
jgi:competence protein ComGC